MLRFIQKTPVIKKVRKAYVSPCGEQEVTATDENEEESCICICQAITPVVRYCQVFGVAPFGFHSSSNTRKPSISTTPKSSATYKEDNEAALGITPSFHQKKRKKCGISTKWNSFPSFTNAFLLLSFASVTIWFFVNITTVLTVYFEGTDLYTFMCQTLCLYSQCNLILINSFIQRQKFCDIWALITKILRDLLRNSGDSSCKLPPLPLNPILKKESTPELLLSNQSPFTATNTNAKLNNFAVATTILQNLGHHCRYHQHRQVQFEDRKVNQNGKDVTHPSKIKSRLKILRICSYISVLTVLILSVLHVISFIHLVFTGCFDKSTASLTISKVVLGNPPCPFNSLFLFLQKLFYGMIDFVQQGVAILFGMLCLVIYIFFEEIEDQLEKILNTTTDLKSIGLQQNYQIDKLRMIYEDLSKCCRLMSRFFGPSVLAVMITSVVSITCALYSFTLYSGVLKKEQTLQIARYYVIWAFHGWFGTFCLILILIPGQMITNASASPSHVIGRCSLTQLDKETKYQLSQFQHQCRDKVVISAWNVTNVGLGFIAAAATNVTTYILVILQFRLGVEK